MDSGLPRDLRAPGSGDPVDLSVAAYSAHAEAYPTEHAGKMIERVECFAEALPPNSVILDAGCGPGRDLARFTARGHFAYGLDLNPEFVVMANEHAATRRGDLREVASLFSRGSFDAIWACASLVHLTETDTVSVLGQFANLIRPGGKLYAAVKATGETGWLDEPDGRRWYTVWNADRFADAVGGAGFVVDSVVRGAFVEVWADLA